MIEKSWSSQLLFSVAGENGTVIYSVCFSGTSRKIAMIWLKNENLKTHALLFFLGSLN